MAMQAWDTWKQRIPHLAGWVLVVLWLGWWLINLSANHLVGGSKTWVPRFPILGIDFLYNQQGVQVWLAGGNPYREVLDLGSASEFYGYPPLALRVFAWSALLNARAAVAVWMIVLTGLSVLVTWVCWNGRVALGLPRPAFSLALGCVLWSTPVLYSLERGNFDLLVLVLLLAVAALLGRNARGADWLAGGCLAAAVGLKVYPVLCGFLFLVLRRPHAVLGAAVAGVALVLMDVPGTLDFLHNSREVFGRHAPFAHGRMHETMHTLPGMWPLLWQATPLEWLTAIPGQAAWAALMLPAVGLIGYRIWNCPQPTGVVLPALLWLTAVATFLPVVSNDYNLICLPLAVVAVWKIRDRVETHILVGLLLLWWQPFLCPIGPRLLLACKLAGVYAVALCLLRHLARQSQPATANPTLQRDLPIAA